jgi:hypothetical protein
LTSSRITEGLKRVRAIGAGRLVVTEQPPQSSKQLSRFVEKVDSGDEFVSIANGLALVGEDEDIALWTVDESTSALANGGAWPIAGEDLGLNSSPGA